jgi:hypothetical protein
MNCVRCGGPIELSKKHCAHCGVPLDADQNGVPDAIEQLIEDKARAIVAADRAREQHELQAQRERKEREQREQREREERTQREQYERERHDRLLGELSYARQTLETTRRTPRRIWALSRGGVVAIALLALMLGVPFSCVAQGISGRSLAGEVLCSRVCEGCSAPARVFSWTRTRDGNRSEHSRTLCSHPSVDLQQLTTAQVSDEPRYDAIELPRWLETLVAFELWFLAGLAGMPFLFAWFERKRLADDERRLTSEIATLLRALAADTPPTPRQLYR